MGKSLAAMIGICVLSAPTAGFAAGFTEVCLRSTIFKLSGERYYWYADGYTISPCLGAPLPTAIVAPWGDGPDVECDDCIKMRVAPPSAEVPQPEVVSAQRTAPDNANDEQAASDPPEDVEVPVGEDFDYYTALESIEGESRARKPHPLSQRRLFEFPSIDPDAAPVRVYLFPVIINVERADGGAGKAETRLPLAIGFQTTAEGPADTLTRDDIVQSSAFIDEKGQHVGMPQRKAFYRFNYNDEVCDAIVFLAEPNQ